MRLLRSWVALRRDVLIKALRETLVGMLFALTAAPFIFWVGDSGRLTSDWSQRIHFLRDAKGGALGEGGTPNPAVPKSWYFVDLNGAFCNPGGDTKRCPPDLANTDHVALADLLENILAQKPRLVIVDILLAKSGAAKDDEILLGALQKSKIPVLLSWAPRAGPLDTLTMGARDDALLFSLDPAKAPNNVRYLPAIKSMTGSTARYLHPYHTVALADHVANFPSIAYGAALVLASSPENPFKRLDNFNMAHGPQCGVWKVTHCSDYMLTQRIFSFPRRAPHEDVLYVGNHNDPYFARVESVDSNPGAEAALKDAVVIVGNSDFAAGDQAWSALGDVSGAELILNDTRQYLINPANPQKGFLTNFANSVIEEWAFYLLSAVSIFLTECFVDTRWPLREERSGHDTLGSAARQFLRSLGKLLIGVFLSFQIYGLYLFFRPTATVDFVSPFFGGLIQFSIELLFQIKKLFDIVALWLFGGVRLDV